MKDLLESLGIETKEAGEHHHATSGWLQMDCPFCSKGTNQYRLGLNLRSHYFSCWACGPHQFFPTLCELLSLPLHKVKALTQDLSILDEPVKEVSRGTLVLPKYLGPLLRPHRDYLRERGLDPKEVQRLWSLQGIGLAPELQWRLFIPIHLRGEVVSWTTRSIGEPKAKYKNAKPHQEILSGKTILYGSDLARHSIIVVEGPADVWRIGPGAVATLGVEFSKSQVNKMSKYPTRVICFDNESLAQQQAKELCNALKVFPGKTYRVELDAKDAGEASQKEINKLRRLFL